MKVFFRIGSVFVLALCFVLVESAWSETSQQSPVERGRQLVVISGCNDCHTSGYGPLNGQVPESEWLKGDSVGWRGPWGTTYPTNLRIFSSALSEDQWVELLRTSQPRPPMPWWTLRAMSDENLKDIYQYIRSLPVAGDPAPAYLPPAEVPKTPYFTMVLPATTSGIDGSN